MYKCDTAVVLHHRAKGVMSGDSDIQPVGSSDFREISTTGNIAWSARRNIRGMIVGDNTESQFG